MRRKEWRGDEIRKVRMKRISIKRGKLEQVREQNK